MSNEKKTVSPTNGFGKTGWQHAKENEPLSYTINKINSK